MRDRAFAKINLSLNITGVLDNGYHTLESIFLPLNFYDEIEIKKIDSNEDVYTSNNRFIKFNETNTINKAIDLMRKEFDIKDHFSVHLTKCIPMQAGLAGGSTDAASVIRILDKMYKINLSSEKAKEICKKIGADVMFTYVSKPSLVTGIGENIEQIRVKDNYYCLIVKPSKGVSTKACYEAMNLETCPHPNIDDLRLALEEGNDIVNLLGNSMEPAAINLVPEIADVKKDIVQMGGEFALMSGSGSSVFTLSKDENLIKSLAMKLKEKEYFTRFTTIRK